jgi:hypothetical protein
MFASALLGPVLKVVLHAYYACFASSFPPGNPCLQSSSLTTQSLTACTNVCLPNSTTQNSMSASASFENRRCIYSMSVLKTRSALTYVVVLRSNWNLPIMAQQEENVRENMYGSGAGIEKQPPMAKCLTPILDSTLILSLGDRGIQKVVDQLDVCEVDKPLSHDLRSFVESIISSPRAPK